MKAKTSGVEERLKFIEFCLFWDGKVSRPRISKQFNISSQQASSDLKKYKINAPTNIEYSLEKRRYLKTSAFKPALLQSFAQKYIDCLESVQRGHSKPKDTWISELPEIDGLSIPSRKIKDRSFRNLIKAMHRGESLEIKYTARTSSGATVRRITPVALGNDGNRWHVRGFDHDKSRFSDFTISRISGTRDRQKSDITLKDDTAWNTKVIIEIIPNEKLDAKKQEALELEYEMRSGILKVNTTKAMLYYYLRQYGFNPRPLSGDIMPNDSSYYLQIKNFDDVLDWLEVRKA